MADGRPAAGHRPDGRRLDDAFARRVSAARLLATRAHPYFTTALLAMTPVASPGSGTAAVDRWWRLYLDPAAVAGWDVDEMAGVLVHEVGHLLRDHHGRAAAAGVDLDEALMWNLATDAAINDDLVPGRLPLPDPVLPRDLGLAPRGLEEVYLDELRRRRCQTVRGRSGSEPDGGGAASRLTSEDCGSGAHGAPRPWELDGPSAPDLVGAAARAVSTPEADLIRRSVAEAIDRSPGHVPHGWRRWADGVVRPQVDWRRVLRRQVRQATRWVRGNLDHTYSRPDRRADSHPDIIYPGTTTPVVDCAVVIDTSGSMSDAELAAALAETQAALRAAGGASLWVVCCDRATQPPQKVRRLRPVRLVGGGGTDLRAGIAAAAALRPRPSVIVVITDGWTPWPDRAPAGTRVVVVTTDRAVERPGFSCVRIGPPATPSSSSRTRVAPQRSNPSSSRRVGPSTPISARSVSISATVMP